jgi:hypothetical protein
MNFTLIRVDPHPSGTVPFTGSVAALFYLQDLLMLDNVSKVWLFG